MAHLKMKYHTDFKSKTELFHPFSWQSCGVESDTFQLNTFSVNPDPLVRGQKFIVSLKGSLSQAIGPQDVAKVVVKYGGFTLVNSLFNICENLNKIQPNLFPCPIPAGDFDVTHTEILPLEVPPGRYQVHIEAFSSSQFTGIICLDSDFKIASVKDSSMVKMSSKQKPHQSLKQALQLSELIGMQTAFLLRLSEVDLDN